MSYQLIPNLIFVLAVLGLIIIVIKNLPKENKKELQEPKPQSVEQKLEDRGLPTVNISKVKSKAKLWSKKSWDFILEAKDLKQTAKAGYTVKKIFQKPPQKTKGSPNQILEKQILEKIKQDPKNLANYNELGKLYLKKKNFQDATDIYEYLIKHDPGQAEYHAKLGFCKYNLKDFYDSTKHYRASIELDSTQPNRYYNLGLSLEAQGKLADAALAAQKAISMENSNLKFYLGLSSIQEKMGKTQKAKATLEIAQRLEPSNPLVLEKLDKLIGKIK